MELLRTLVSGKKKRFKEDGFNLDLSYITPRLIAMSIPAEGLTSIYRNPLESVSKLLNERHHDKFKIFNLSGIPYDYAKFGGRVIDRPWPDHYPPPIKLLFEVCKEMHEWLIADNANVVAVNCRAGKGRTGTVLCCYLIYSGRINTASEALKYYKLKRFTRGGGVTQPSQVRYVYYFEKILKGEVKGPLLVRLSKITLRTAPHCSGNTSRCYIEIFKDDRLLYTSKESSRGRQPVLQDNWEDSKIHQMAIINCELLLQGDILCKLYHAGKWKFKKICRLSFNTGFIPFYNVLTLQKTELDPHKFKCSKKVSEKFAINFVFDNSPCPCPASVPLEDRCQLCKANIEKQEKENWEFMRFAVSERVQNDPKVLLFGDSNDDVDDILALPDEESDFSDGSV